MKFLRSRAEQVTEHLRDCILRGELVAPLPTTREWSRLLGVSRPTLRNVLRVLQREGHLRVHPRGVYIGTDDPPPGARALKMVRMIYFGADLPDISHFMIWLAPLSDRLHSQGIQLITERCSGARLRAILREKTQSSELLFLVNMRAEHHKLFAKSRKRCVVLGEPDPPSAVAVYHNRPGRRCAARRADVPAAGVLADQLGDRAE